MARISRVLFPETELTPAISTVSRSRLHATAGDSLANLCNPSEEQSSPQRQSVSKKSRIRRGKRDKRRGDKDKRLSKPPASRSLDQRILRSQSIQDVKLSRKAAGRSRSMDILSNLSSLQNLETEKGAEEKNLPKKKAIASRNGRKMPKRAATSLDKENMNPMLDEESSPIMTKPSRARSVRFGSSVFENLPAQDVFENIPTQAECKVSSVVSPLTPQVYLRKEPDSRMDDECEIVEEDEKSPSPPPSPQEDRYDECLLSPSVAPKRSKRVDTKATPVQICREIVVMKATPVQSKSVTKKSQRKQKLDCGFLSPSVAPKPSKRMDGKMTPLFGEEFGKKMCDQTPAKDNIVRESCPSPALPNERTPPRSIILIDVLNKVATPEQCQECQLSSVKDFFAAETDQCGPKVSTAAASPQHKVKSLVYDCMICSPRTKPDVDTKLSASNGNVEERNDSNFEDSQLNEGSETTVLPGDNDFTPPTREKQKNEGSAEDVKDSRPNDREIVELTLSPPKEVKDNSRTKSDIIDLTLSPPRDSERYIRLKREDEDDKEVVGNNPGRRRSARNARPVDRFIASFKRKRKRGSRKTTASPKKESDEGDDVNDVNSVLAAAKVNENNQLRRSFRDRRPVQRFIPPFSRKKKYVENKSNGKDSSDNDLHSSLKSATNNDLAKCADVVAAANAKQNEKVSECTGELHAEKKLADHANACIEEEGIQSGSESEDDIFNETPIRSPVQTDHADDSHRIPANEAGARKSSRHTKPVDRLHLSFKRRSRNKKDGETKADCIISPKIPQKRFTSKTYVATGDTGDQAWHYTLLDHLKRAHGDVDPMSSVFWQDVASRVEGKSAEECRDKWFSMVGTPQKKSVRKVDNNIGGEPNTDDVEDDIFNSTPVREANNVTYSLPSSPKSTRSQTLTRLLDIFSSPIVYKRKEENKENHIADYSSPLFFRPQYKTYLREVRAGINDKTRNFKSKRANGPKKKNKHLTVSIEDGEIHMGGVLSPGGTLLIQAPDDDELANMYIENNESPWNE